MSVKNIKNERLYMTHEKSVVTQASHLGSEIVHPGVDRRAVQEAPEVEYREPVKLFKSNNFPGLTSSSRTLRDAIDRAPLKPELPSLSERDIGSGGPMTIESLPTVARVPHSVIEAVGRRALSSDG